MDDPLLVRFGFALLVLRVRVRHRDRAGEPPVRRPGDRTLQVARGLQRPGQHLVEVDLLGALERPLQLSAELVHAGVEALDHLGTPLVRRPVGPPADDEQDEKEHHESAETHADPNKQVRRRHDPATVKKPALPTDCSGGLSR